MKPDRDPEPRNNAPEVCARLFQRAHATGASDLHIQPLPDGDAQVSLRQDGVLRPIERLPADYASLVIGRIKFLAKLKTFEHALPQDGRISQADAGVDQELRVSTYPTVAGEKVVIRFFTEQRIHQLDQLGLDLSVLQKLQTFLASGQRLLLLTGPSGSGKTTTIYSCLKQITATDSRHVITIEDPVEQVIDGIMQTEVNEARGLDFPKSLRHLLRQDPEVIVIGEIRDDETAGIAVRACLTGHQVIATLHAGSCQGVLDRLRLMVDDPYALATVVGLVVNQRLLRRQCETCQGRGCATCSQTGYSGRVPIAETLTLSDADRQEWQHGRPIQAQPEPTLRQSAQRLIDLGITDTKEVTRILGS